MKNLSSINCIYEMNELKQRNIIIFANEFEKINYKLITDGCLEHIGTFIDRCPFASDTFLLGANCARRFDFTLSEANFLLVKKEYKDKKENCLYITKDAFDILKENSFYEVSINTKRNIKVKKVGEL